MVTIKPSTIASPKDGVANTAKRLTVSSRVPDSTAEMMTVLRTAGPEVVEANIKITTPN